MSEEETISAPFGEAEMSLLVLLDEVPPNGFEIDHKAEADVLQALARRFNVCLLYTSPSPRDVEESRMPSSA